MRRVRALGAGPVLSGLILFGAAALCVAAALAGCGGQTPADSQTAQSGPPPAAAPGILAWAVGEEGNVLGTRDGGAQWTRRPFFLHENGIDVDFSDAATGWLATDAGTVLRSADGGRRWKVAKVFTLQVKALAAGDADHAWVVCNATGAAGEPTGAYVFRTSDGGATWERTRLRRRAARGRELRGRQTRRAGRAGPDLDDPRRRQRPGRCAARSR